MPNSKKSRTPAEADVMVTSGSDNVFRDIGLPDADELARKHDLIMTIDDAIKTRGLKGQVAIAKALDTDQPTVSKLLKHRIQDFSVDRLITFLGLLSQDVSIVVHPAPAGRLGQVRVVSKTEFNGTIPSSEGRSPAKKATYTKSKKKLVAVA
jgi:predicted XRE-type DNA-binding protein